MHYSINKINDEYLMITVTTKLIINTQCFIVTSNQSCNVSVWLQ